MKRLDSATFMFIALALGACSASEGDETVTTSVAQAVSDPALVFGYENVADWTVTSGIKSSTTDKTQGAAALAIKSFTFTELTSSQLGTLSGVTSNMRLDVKPPPGVAWGSIQLFVSVPSRGVYNAAANSVSLVGLPSSAYSTVSFTLPANVVTALQQSYADATFKLTINAPQSSTDFKIDNLRFQGSITNSKVELRVSNVDDFLYITVGGVRRKVSYINDPSQGTRQDISSWFGAGNNTVRIQNINTGGPTNYRVELWVDGQLALDDSAPAGLTKQGIAVDRTFPINTPNRPAFRTVTVNGSPSGKLYLDDVYTGVSTPATLTLPQGSYKLGLGVSTDTPPSYTGSFYEQSISVGSSNQTVNLTSTSPVGLRKTNTVVVVPVKNTWNYTTAAGGADPSNLGVLNQSDVTLLSGQINATRDQWFRPFTYGLATWQATVLPMVTNVALKEPEPDGLAMDTFLTEAGLNSLRQQYDRVVVYFSQQRADGTNVVDHYGSVFALGRQLVGYTSEYAKFRTATQPSPWLLHEFMHNHEAYNQDILHEYNGIDGLHGAEQHGYPSEQNSGETDYVKFYRLYLRSQLAETGTMSPGTKPAAPPSNADIFLGLLKTLPVYTGK